MRYGKFLVLFREKEVIRNIKSESFSKGEGVRGARLIRLHIWSTLR